MYKTRIMTNDSILRSWAWMKTGDVFFVLLFYSNGTAKVAIAALNKAKTITKETAPPVVN